MQETEVKFNRILPSKWRKSHSRQDHWPFSRRITIFWDAKNYLTLEINHFSKWMEKIKSKTKIKSSFQCGDKSYFVEQMFPHIHHMQRKFACCNLSSTHWIVHRRKKAHSHTPFQDLLPKQSRHNNHISIASTFLSRIYDFCDQRAATPCSCAQAHASNESCWKKCNLAKCWRNYYNLNWNSTDLMEQHKLFKGNFSVVFFRKKKSFVSQNPIRQNEWKWNEIICLGFFFYKNFL